MLALSTASTHGMVGGMGKGVGGGGGEVEGGGGGVEGL